ncbi:autotransporter-associated beta strand repeat-containing protein [Novosphingobium resinovorum]|uniref:autotransporter-associated beta strand repeat-containing protein n=1 Tax=Novosphingobium resinovorum TaxID=158500 RepID=UPI002ED44C7D|nr:autotransporter-associated beta strand repeat-containing protein [Novosphingobium resinovorum]
MANPVRAGHLRTRLLVSACFAVLPLAAHAQDATTVTASRTSALSMDGSDTLTVASGANFQVTGNQAVNVNGASSGDGILITNDGTIEALATSASNGRAISGSTDFADRTATIVNRGTIRGANDAIRFSESTVGGDGGTITIDNYGTIVSTGLDNAGNLAQQAQGVDVTVTGVTLDLTNHAGATISGSQGVVTTAITNLVNAGTITGTGAVSGQGEGVRSNAGGSLNLTNEATGSITGIYGVIGAGNTTIVNRGTISGTDGDAGTYTREAIRINLSASSTVNSVTLANGSLTRAGTGASASGYAVYFGGTGVAGTVNTLTVETGAVIEGGLRGNSTTGVTDILNLTGSGAQVLGTFAGFDELHVLGGSWAITSSQTLSGGATIASGATLRYDDLDAENGAYLAGAMVNDGTLVFNRSRGVNQYGTISGSGSVRLTGAGTVVLNDATTYSGDTVISAGRLRTGQIDGAFSANSAFVVTGTGVLDLNDTATTPLARDQTIANLSGDGAVWLGQNNGGTLMTGGAGGDTLFSGVLSQLGGLAKVGTGTLTLSGANTATGLLSVQGGGLALTGQWAGAAEVGNGAALGGTGSVAGVLTVGAGTIAPGSGGIGTLTTGGLVLSSNSVLAYDLGTPGTGDRIQVNGDLTLDGTLNVADVGGFGEGVYRLIDYTGALTDNGLALGTVPNGTISGLLGVQTSAANQVNLVYGAQTATDIQFWDGSATVANGAVDGGSGSWTNLAANWTDANGGANAAWDNAFAVFQGTAGTVTVDDAIVFTGAQFMTGGYEIAAGTGTLTTDTALTNIRVDPGLTGTISAAIGGTGGLVKNDSGTLVLSGANSYGGATSILGGTVVALGGSAIPASSAVIVAGGGTLDIRADQTVGGLGGAGQVVLGATLTTGGLGNADSFSGTISGSGGLVKTGTGSLTLGGANTYDGTTTVATGTLALQGSVAEAVDVAGGAVLTGSGSAGGTVTLADNATLVVGGAGAGTFTSGGLVLSSGSVLEMGLGAPNVAGASDRLQVNGNLTLDGTLNVTDLGGFGIGVYRLADYTGTLTDNGLDIGVLPTGIDGDDVTVQTSVTSQVNLVYDREIAELQFWDGAATTANGAVDGGSGSWTTTDDNWTDANGTANDSWGGRFAVFQGQAGTVTVDGAIGVTGMQFMTNGYTLAAGTGALSVLEAQTNLRVDPGVTATIAASIGGNGGIAKLDAGTLVLGAANSYAGATTVSGGTLRAGVAGALPAGTDVTVAAGATLDLASFQAIASLAGDGSVTLSGGDLVTGGGDGSTRFGGVISGSGALSKAGSGVFTLAGANTYTGGTTVSAGILRLDGGTLGSGALAVASGATLDLNGASSTVGTLSGAGAIQLGSGTLTAGGSANSSFTGIIGGTGSLGKTGTGTLTLSGANTYSGGTTVAGGTLAAGAANVLGSGTLTVASGANAALGNFAQTVGGLSGEGTIALGSAILTVNGAGNTSYSGVLSGTGRLIKTGTGTLVLGGANTYTGSTSITGGTLIVNGSLAGTVSLGASGTLGGSGKVGSLNVAGTVSPGNSIGTLNVAGSLTFQNASTYLVEVSPNGTADRITATGAVTIQGGTVSVLGGGQTNFSPLTTYTILSGSSVTGTFSSVTSDLAFLTPSLVYNAADVELRLLRNDASFASVAVTANQAAVAGVVEAQGDDPAGGALFDAAIGLNAEDARDAFDQLSGEILVAVSTIAGRDGHDAARDLIGRLDGPRGQRLSAWVAGDIGRLAAGSQGDFAKVNSDRKVVEGGVEYTGTHLRAGLAYRYSKNEIDLSGRAGSADLVTNSAYAYLGYIQGGLRIAGGFGYAAHTLSTERAVAFGGLSNDLRSDSDGRSYVGFGEVSYAVPVGKTLRVGPYGGISAASTTLGALEEWGGAAALAGERTRDTTVLASYGAHGSATFDGGFQLAADIGARSYLDNAAPRRTLRFVDGGDSFEIGAARYGTTALTGRIEGSASVGRVLLGLGVHGETGGGASGYGFRASAGFRF